MGFWKLFKESWHDQMVQYGFTQPDQGTGDGYDTDPELEKWKPIYEKFRTRIGRDPYSFRELQDWFNQL